MEKIDIISDVFSTLRIRSNLYFRAHLGDQSAVRVPEERRRIRFHLVLQGSCWIGTDAMPALLASTGDIVLVPNGAAQTLSVDPGNAAVALERLIADGALCDGKLRAGDGPAHAVVLCGFCRFDESIDHPALAGLPSLIHLRLSDLGAEPWVAATLKLLELEANLDAQGTTAILGRLIEIVVIQATRRLASGRLASEDQGSGFVAALADRSLSRALRAMHRAPEKSWSVGALAEEAGMSRTRFAHGFANSVGIPPMEYLTNWRLLRARALLAETTLGIEDIAERCGYASLPSFSRRFKQRFGLGPGAFRRTAAVVGS